MKKNQQIVLLAIVIVVLVVLVWFVFRASPSPATPSNTVGNATSTMVNATNSQAVAPSGKPPVKGAVISPPQTVIAPTANARWIFGESNTIQWDKAAKITGGIYLVDAATGKTVGWLLTQTAGAQTSFPWNTRDLLQSRTNPTKTTVPVGTYIVKVMFDSPEDPTITSAPFSIIYPSQVQIPAYTANIYGITFTPTSLTAKRGGKITFINNDQSAYALTLSGFTPINIPAGSSYTFDTTPLSPGPYVFYSVIYPTLRLNVTVQ